MKFPKIRTRGARIIAAAMCVLGLALPASVAIPATAAQATSACAAVPEGSNVYSVPYGCTNVVMAHKCFNLYTIPDTNISDDECADIDAQNTSGVTQVWGTGEFYCQGQYTQCQGMNVTVDASFSSVVTNSPIGKAETVAPAHYKCNPNPGPACPGGRKYVSTSRYDNLGTSGCVYTYSWDPYDGWKGNSQVISLKTSGLANHVSFELDSQNVVVCFEGS